MSALGSISNGGATDADLEAFRNLLPALLTTDPGRYVAISNGQVMDSDTDEFALAERVCRQHQAKPVLIQKVVPGVLEDVSVDSPEIE